MSEGFNETNIAIETYYWIAVNGASAAMTPYPLPRTVRCIPTPQLLIGFKRLNHAKTFQSIALNAPLPIVRKELKLLKKHRDAVLIEPNNPEPPTTGPTLWRDK